MKKMICIICPNGCELSLEEKNGERIVCGNKCPKGMDFAIKEITSPMRTLTTTVLTTFADFPLLSVKTSGEIPKDRVFDVMKALKSVRVTEKLKCYDIVVKSILDLGIDVIASQDIL